MIVLSTAFNSEGDTATCGIYTANVTNIANIAMMMGNPLQLSSTISFTASSELDGTEVMCTDATPTVVQSYQIRIVGK